MKEWEHHSAMESAKGVDVVTTTWHGFAGQAKGSHEHDEGQSGFDLEQGHSFGGSHLASIIWGQGLCSSIEPSLARGPGMGW